MDQDQVRSDQEPCSLAAIHSRQDKAWPASKPVQSRSGQLGFVDTCLLTLFFSAF